MNIKGIVPCAGGRIEIYDSKVILVKRKFDWHRLRFFEVRKTFEYSEISNINFLMPTFFRSGFIEFVTHQTNAIAEKSRNFTSDNLIKLSCCSKARGEFVCSLYHLILDLKAAEELSINDQGREDDGLENVDQSLTSMTSAHPSDSAVAWEIDPKYSRNQLAPFTAFSTRVAGIYYYQDNVKQLISNLEAENLIEPNIFYPDGQVWKYYSGSRIYEFDLHQVGEMVLEHEPGNLYDSHAIRVTIHADDGRSYFIGYIPRDLTNKVAPIIDDPEFSKKFFIHYSIGGGNYKYLDLCDSETISLFRGHTNYYAHLQIIKY